MPVEFVVEPEAAGAAERVAALLVTAVRLGRSIALCGGSTPGAAYRRAAELEPDWSGATVWLGDDRHVPRDDPRSNVRLLQETLFDRLARQPVFHPCAEDPDPAAVAADYDALLRREGVPSFQLLGLGADGHTASLFPNAAALAETGRLAVAAPAGLDPFVDRITMTIPALCAAEHVVFLVTGATKAEVARAAFAGEPSATIPASLVRSAAGTTTVVLDDAAAARL